MLESVELEAHMSAQQKLDEMMKQEDKDDSNGDTPGFIKTHVTK